MGKGGGILGKVFSACGKVFSFIIGKSAEPSQQAGDYNAGYSKTGADFEKPVIYGRSRCDGHRTFREVLNEPISAQTREYVAHYMQQYWNYTIPAQGGDVNSIVRAALQAMGFNGSETDGSYATFVYGFGEGPINAFKQVYIDDVPLFIMEMSVQNGVVGRGSISPEFRDHVQVEFSNGDRSNPYWLTLAGLNSDGKYKPSFKGYGCPAMAIKVKLDPNNGKIKQDGFNVAADIEGRLLKDVRYANQAPAWRTSNGGLCGRNPALALYDYLTQPYGGDLDEKELDLDSFIQAANYCETNNLFIDGCVNQRQECSKNNSQILSCFDGYLTRTNGIIGVYVNQPAVTAMSFNTNDNIVDSSIKMTCAKAEKYFNQLEVTVTDKATGKRDVILYPQQIPDAIIKRDRKRITSRLDLPLVKDKGSIDFLASREYMKAQYQTSIKFTADADGFLVSMFDVVEVSIPEFNMTNKQFRITGYDADPETLTVQIEADEYNAAIFSAYWTGIPVNIEPNKPRTVKPVSQLKAAVVEFNAGYTMQLQWKNNDSSTEDYQVMFKLSADPDSRFQTYTVTKNDFITLERLNGSLYDFAVMARNVFGTNSQWTYLRNVDVKDDTLLPAVTNVRLKNKKLDAATQTNDRDFIIEWDSMLDSVVKKIDPQFNVKAYATQTVKNVMSNYEVEVYHAGNLKQTIQTQVPIFTYTFEQNQANTLSRDVEFKVYIRGKGGALSPLDKTSSITVRNPQIAQPTGYKAVGSVDGARLNWERPVDLDYAGTQVHMSKTPKFIPSASTLIAQPVGTFYFHTFDPRDTSVYYVKVAHYDIFGTGDMNYSPEEIIMRKDVTDFMTDINKDQLASTLSNEISGKVDRTEFNTVIKKEVGDVVIALNKDISTIIKPQIDDLKTQLTKEVGDRKAADVTLTKQVEDADKAISIRIDSVKATADKATTDIGKANAEITSVKSAYAAADTQLSNKVDTVAATTAKNAADALTATIKTEQTARTTADSALGVRIDNVTTDFKTADSTLKADYTKQISTISNETKQIASRIETVKVEATKDALTAANTYTDNKVLTGDADTLNKANNAIKAGDARSVSDANKYSDAKAVVTALEAEKDAAAKAAAAQKAAIEEAAKRDAATLVSAKGEIQNEANARQQADEVITEDVKKLRSETTSKANALQATIDTTNKTVTTLTTSTASQINTLSTSINGVKGQVQTVAETTSNIDGKLKSTYVIRTDANGVVAGVGLISDAAAKQSKMLFSADSMLFTTPSNKTGFPLFEINQNGALIQNALIRNLSATNIGAGAIQAHHIQAGSITGDKLVANVSLSSPIINAGTLNGVDLNLGNIFMNSGAAGFGKGGPFGGWGLGWNTIIYADGQIHTNRLYASGGEFNNVVIKENCQVLGTLFADRIVGLPQGKVFGRGSEGVPLGGQWQSIGTHTIQNPQGRFNQRVAFTIRGRAGAFHASMYGATFGSWLGIRVLLNGNQIYSEVVRNIPMTNHDFFVNDWNYASAPIALGTGAGTIDIQITTVNHYKYNANGIQENWNANRNGSRDYNILSESMQIWIYSAIDR